MAVRKPLCGKVGSWSAAFVLLAQAQSPPQPQMDASTRARALVLLAGLAIFGAAAIFLLWVGSRAARRAMSGSTGVRRRCGASPTEDDWAGKPLISESQIPEEDAGR